MSFLFLGGTETHKLTFIPLNPHLTPIICWERKPGCTLRLPDSDTVVNTQKLWFSSLWRFPLKIMPPECVWEELPDWANVTGGAAWEMLNLFWKKQQQELWEPSCNHVLQDESHEYVFLGATQEGRAYKPYTQQHSACATYFRAYWVHTKHTENHRACWQTFHLQGRLSAHNVSHAEPFEHLHAPLNPNICYNVFW